MTTFYLDLENGNDAADGTSFANRWKTLTSGATAARIAPGDVIRIMGCPAPTLIGDCDWNRWVRDGAMPAAVNISAVSNATPIVITTSAVHGLTSGDVVQIVGQTGNRYINGLWEVVVLTTTTFELVGSVAAGSGGNSTGNVRLYTSRVIVADTPVNATIDMCEVAWTQSANVTSTLSTTNKQGDSAQQLAIAAGFTTGKVAYRALPATIDLSGYQQVTFWVRVNATLAASTLSLRLCSDGTGDTTVDTIAIPAITGNNRWVPITVDKGSALGSSIASIALHADLDPGTITVLLDCIVAVKAPSADDSLGLQSLISPGNNWLDETFYPIASIERGVIALDCGPDWICGSLRHMGWWGTTDSYATYKLEPIQMAMVASGDIGLTFQDNGSAGNLITFSGGWNRSDMSTQTGITFVDCRNGLSTGFVWNSRSFLNLDLLGVVRAATGWGDSVFSNSTIGTIHSNGCQSSGIQFGTCSALTVTSIFACNNNNSGVLIGRSNNTAADIDWGDCFKKLNGNGGNRVAGSNTGLGITGSRMSFGTIAQLCANWGSGALQSTGLSCSQVRIDSIAEASDNQEAVLMPAGFDLVIDHLKAERNGRVFTLTGSGREVRVHDIESADNAVAVFNSNGSNQGSHPLVRVGSWVSTDSILNGLTAIGSAMVAVDRWGGVVGDSRVFVAGGDIQTETSVRHTASGVAWRIAPTLTSTVTAAWPLTLPIAQVACEASKLVTIKAWVRRSHADLSIGICAKRDQLAGMASDQTAWISVAADTWEEITITFTPTEAGVVEIVCLCYGGTTHYGYIDDLTLEQAA